MDTKIPMNTTCSFVESTMVAAPFTLYFEIAMESKHSKIKQYLSCIFCITKSKFLHHRIQIAPSIVIIYRFILKSK